MGLLVDRVLTDVPRDRVGIVVKIEDMIQSCLRCYDDVIRGNINSQIMRLWKLKQLGK